MADGFVLMEYQGDSPALLRTEVLPSGTRYEYSGMPHGRRIMVDLLDVDALKALDFKRVEMPKAEAERMAEAEQDAEQAREFQKTQGQAVVSADEPKGKRKA